MSSSVNVCNCKAQPKLKTRRHAFCTWLHFSSQMQQEKSSFLTCTKCWLQVLAAVQWQSVSHPPHTIGSICDFYKAWLDSLKVLRNQLPTTAALVTFVVSDYQRERPVERRREFKPQRRGAGPDERGGSENEQRSAHHVARSSERMVSFKCLCLIVQHMYVLIQKSRNLTVKCLILVCTSTPPWLSGRNVCIL